MMGRVLDQALALKASVALSSVIGETVALRRNGPEFIGLCPIHDERTPSFTVSDARGWFHCFGCGAHGDVLDWLQKARGMTLREAIEHLGGERPAPVYAPRPAVSDEPQPWVPVMPVPVSAHGLVDGGATRWIENPKREKRTRLRPSLVHAYRDADGALLGYVLRCECGDGKITPQVTWCRHEDGRERWAMVNFPKPRPLYGMDLLAERPSAQVVLVEGEKTADAARLLLPQCVVVTWPGGCKGVAHVDWSPLAGRDVITVEDSDDEGRGAMLGWERNGSRVAGIIERLTGAASRVRRCVPDGTLPKGWDLADAAGWGLAEAAKFIRDGLRRGRDSG